MVFFLFLVFPFTNVTVMLSDVGELVELIFLPILHLNAGGYIPSPSHEASFMFLLRIVTPYSCPVVFPISFVVDGKHRMARCFSNAVQYSFVFNVMGIAEIAPEAILNDEIVLQRINGSLQVSPLIDRDPYG